jgi:WhiB family redox-sensing transcriptional regulator
MDEQDWKINAECREPGVDPEVFFPVSNVGPSVAQIEAAKAVCRRCPVQAQCLAWSLADAVPYGVLGGLDEWERDRLLRYAPDVVTLAANVAA